MTRIQTFGERDLQTSNQSIDVNFLIAQLPNLPPVNRIGTSEAEANTFKVETTHFTCWMQHWRGSEGIPSCSRALSVLSRITYMTLRSITLINDPNHSASNQLTDTRWLTIRNQPAMMSMTCRLSLILSNFSAERIQPAAWESDWSWSRRSGAIASDECRLECRECL